MEVTPLTPRGHRPGSRPLGTKPVPSYGDDPFSPFLRRAQNDRLRRSRGRKLRLRLLPVASGVAVLGLLAGSVFGVRWYLTHSARFRLNRIALTPTDHAPQTELRRIAERYRGRNIFSLDLARIERELEQVRWVRTAMVRRVLPDRLLCSVEERQPRGLALLKGRVQVIDEDGTPIDLQVGAVSGDSFPIFTGVDEAGGTRARDQVARGFALVDWIDTTHPGLSKEISEIDLSRSDRIGLLMNSGSTAVRLSADDFGANFDRWLQMRDYLATHFGDGAYVDLRFKDRITFQPLLARRN